MRPLLLSCLLIHRALERLVTGMAKSLVPAWPSMQSARYHRDVNSGSRSRTESDCQAPGVLVNRLSRSFA